MKHAPTAFFPEYARMTAQTPPPSLAEAVSGTDAERRDRWIALAQERGQVIAELTSALAELLDLVDMDATFENRDLEPYKFEAIVDDVKARARKAIVRGRAA